MSVLAAIDVSSAESCAKSETPRAPESFDQLPDRDHAEAPLEYSTDSSNVSSVVEPVTPVRENKGIHPASKSTVQEMVTVIVFSTHGLGVDCAIALSKVAPATYMG